MPGPNSFIAAKRTNNENRAWDDSYSCECGAWLGHLGLEPTPQMFVQHLCDIFDGVQLREDGTLWVNLGDTYVEKCAALIPEMFVIEMVRRGWCCRNKIIWQKNNPMPTSANDRFTFSWEYIYFMTKSKKYWFNQQFEEFVTEAKGQPFGGNKRAGGCNATYSGKPYFNQHLPGRNMRDVWTIETSRNDLDHHAQYAPELCLIPILAGCPEKICTKCDKPRYPIYEVNGRLGKSWHDHGKDDEEGAGQYSPERGKNYENIKRVFKGYTDCGCGAPFKKGVVLDPFYGVGNTRVAAEALGRDFIGIDVSEYYVGIAEESFKKRLNSFCLKHKIISTGGGLF